MVRERKKSLLSKLNWPEDPEEFAEFQRNDAKLRDMVWQGHKGVVFDAMEKVVGVRSFGETKGLEIPTATIDQMDVKRLDSAREDLIAEAKQQIKSESEPFKMAFQVGVLTVGARYIEGMGLLIRVESQEKTITEMDRFYVDHNNATIQLISAYELPAWLGPFDEIKCDEKVILAIKIGNEEKELQFNTPPPEKKAEASDAALTDDIDPRASGPLFSTSGIKDIADDMREKITACIMLDNLINIQQPALMLGEGDDADDGPKEQVFQLSSIFDKGVLNKYLPWIGARLTMKVYIDKNDSSRAVFTASVDVLPEARETCGSLHIEANTEEGICARVDLTYEDYSGILEPDGGNWLPSDIRKVKFKVLIGR